MSARTPIRMPRGRRIRTRMAVEAAKSGRPRAGRDEPACRTCPRCGHWWLEGKVPNPHDLDWPGRAVDHLVELGVVSHEVEPTLRAVVRAATATARVDEIAELFGISRTQLRRRLTRSGLPPTNRVVCLGRAAALAEYMLRWHVSGAEAARRLPLSDAGALNNHIHRYLGWRFEDLRQLPEPQWGAIAERWVEQVVGDTDE